MNSVRLQDMLKHPPQKKYAPYLGPKIQSPALQRKNGFGAGESTPVRWLWGSVELKREEVSMLYEVPRAIFASELRTGFQKSSACGRKQRAGNLALIVSTEQIWPPAMLKICFYIFTLKDRICKMGTTSCFFTLSKLTHRTNDAVQMEHGWVSINGDPPSLSIFWCHIMTDLEYNESVERGDVVESGLYP